MAPETRAGKRAREAKQPQTFPLGGMPLPSAKPQPKKPQAKRGPAAVEPPAEDPPLNEDEEVEEDEVEEKEEEGEEEEEEEEEETTSRRRKKTGRVTLPIESGARDSDDDYEPTDDESDDAKQAKPYRSGDDTFDSLTTRFRPLRDRSVYKSYEYPAVELLSQGQGAGVMAWIRLLAINHRHLEEPVTFESLCRENGFWFRRVESCLGSRANALRADLLRGLRAAYSAMCVVQCDSSLRKDPQLRRIYLAACARDYASRLRVFANRAIAQ